MAEGVFTYDNIYNLLHAEKYGSELQDVSSENLDSIKTYLTNKKRLLESQEESTQVFSSQKRATIQIEIDNALRALKDLYEYREKKIINRAVFSVRGGTVVKDTTNMLPQEVDFYNLLIQIIPQNRDAFFKMLEPDGAVPVPVAVEETKPETEAADSRDSTTQTEPAPTEQPVQTVESSTEETTMTKVKFLEAVEEFTGEDLKSYGPYSQSDEAKIPEGIANLLIGQNKVESLKEPEENEVSKTERTSSRALEIGENENEVSKTDEGVLPEVQEAHRPTGQAGEDQSSTED